LTESLYKFIRFVYTFLKILADPRQIVRRAPRGSRPTCWEPLV